MSKHLNRFIVRGVFFLFFLFSFYSSVQHLHATTVQAGFADGLLGESRLDNQRHQPENMKTFSTLGISQAIISQDSDDGTFGGSQGNDYDVTVTFLFSDGTTYSFPAAVNWRDTQGSTVYGIGLIVNSRTDDGTTYYDNDLTADYYQTYLLGTGKRPTAYKDDTSNPISISGNAANSGLLAALNAYVTEQSSAPVGDPSPLTATITAADSEIAADGSTTTTITIQVKDLNGKNITTGGDTLTLSTDAGTLSSITDNNDGTYTATLTSSSTVETATITGTLNGDNINDSASVDFISVPVITGPSGGAGSATSAISVYENQTSVTTMSANQTVTWSISGGNDNGDLSINSSTGVITFNTAPNYESPADSDTNNTYIIEITATNSSTGTASTQTLTVTVLDLNASISGTYTNGAGTALSGVTITLLDSSNATVTTTTTDGSGDYTFSELEADTYKVRFPGSGANKGKGKSNTGRNNGRDVENISISYSGGTGSTITDVDGIAIDPAGVVYDAVTRSPVSGATVQFLFGGSPVPNSWLDQDLGGTNTQTTGADGTYAFVLNSNASSGTYTLSVTAPSGYTFESVAIPSEGTTYTSALGGGIETIQSQSTAPTTEQDTTYYLSFSFTIADDAASSSNGVINNHIPIDPTPEVSIAASTSSASEPSTNGEYTVTLSTASASNTIIAYTIGGTATNGTDYNTLSGSLTIAAGSLTGTIPVTVIDDSSDEGSETVIVTLDSISSGTATIDTANDDATVTIADDDGDVVNPIITGPSGGAGSATSAISVYENQTAVTTMSANESVTWSITGGDDQALFSINSSTGVITFDSAPDYESPGDNDTDNDYVLIITATDGAGNTSTQTLTVTVLDVDENAPSITGPSGTAGSATDSISVYENQTAVTTLSANESVTWSITGGVDQALFSINSSTGVITFDSAPDYESPSDSNGDNQYVLIVTATDSAGNTSTQTITVTVLDVAEAQIQTLLNNIKPQIKEDLQTFAFQSLQDTVRSHEQFLAMEEWECEDIEWEESKGLDVSEDQLGGFYGEEFNNCLHQYRMRYNVGYSLAAVNSGDPVSRLHGTVMVERNLNEKSKLGLALTGAYTDNNKLSSYSNSDISDQSIALTLYGRQILNENSYLSAYFSQGWADYDFRLNSSNGLTVNGTPTGERQVFGLAGTYQNLFYERPYEIDIRFSRAIEKIGTVNVTATDGSTSLDDQIQLGILDTNRLSIPVSLQVHQSEITEENNFHQTEAVAGLLCQDQNMTSSSLTCGYQLGIHWQKTHDQKEYQLRYDYSQVQHSDSHSIQGHYTHLLDEENSISLSSTTSAYSNLSSADFQENSWDNSLELAWNSNYFNQNPSKLSIATTPLSSEAQQAFEEVSINFEIDF